MSDTLMVGVSGIRGIVGTDLTPETVARYAAAFGAHLRERAPAARAARPRRLRVVLGRDARTSGEMFAAAASAGLRSVGCDVIDVGVVPTPTVQLAVERHRAAGGIVLTASHNPIEWNALKFVGADGLFIDTAAGDRVRTIAATGQVPRAGWDGVGDATRDDTAVARHLDAVLALPAVNARAVRRRRFRVALDAVRGAGGPPMRELLERLGCRVSGINLEADGRFPRPPEPVPEHLGALGRLVRRARADVGFAVDPDVDRLAVVDERGRPIGEDYTLAFAVRAVLGASPRARRAPVVCNLSTSLVVDDAAREFGAAVDRAPVGEAHVARKMLARGAVIGGEGNGGVMYAPLHAGRDAPVAAALVLALLARRGSRVSELVAAAPRYAIVKARVSRGAALDAVYAGLRARFPDAAANTEDGLRLAWPDRWLHVRASNTEPIIRLIAEAPQAAAARQLVEEGQRLCAAS